MNKRFIFAAILLTICLDFFNLGMIFPIFSSIVFENTSGLIPLGASEFYKNTIFGLLIAAFPFGQFLGAPVIGKLSDQYGKRKLLIASLIGTVVTLFICALGVSGSFLGLLFLGRFLGGSMAGNVTIAYAALADFSTAEDKVKNFALIPLVTGAGFALGPAVVAALAEKGPVFPFVAAALFSVINLGLVIWKFPFMPTTQQKLQWKESFLTGITNIRKAFQKNQARPYFWVLFFMLSSNLLFVQFAGPFGVEKFHINVAEVGYLYINMGFAVSLGHFFLTRKLADYLSSERALSWSLVAMAAILAILTFSWNIVALHITTFFMMLACAVAYSNAMALVSNQGGKDQQGEIMGIAVSIQSCAEFLPAAIVGLIAAASQSISILVAALCALFSYLVLLPLLRKIVPNHE